MDSSYDRVPAMALSTVARPDLAPTQTPAPETYMKIKEVLQKICPNCNKEFKTTRTNKIYCNSKCQFGAWNKLHPRTK